MELSYLSGIHIERFRGFELVILFERVRWGEVSYITTFLFLINKLMCRF